MRIAIAEVCGWKMYCQEAIDGNWGTKDRWITAPDGTSQFRHDIPDYPNDLNAMHEAVMTLDPELQTLYVDALLAVIHRVDAGYFSKIGWCEGWDIAIASPIHRAEAFLRTLGLWKEEA